MAELAELVVLIGISLILVVKVVFRPTTADITRKELAVSVSGKKPPERSSARNRPGEASQIYRGLL